MSLEFCFAITPFDQDETTDQLYIQGEHEEEEPKLAMGVQMLGFQGDANRRFVVGGISSNIIEEKTDGAWSAFLEGGPLTWDSNGRFILLRNRRQQMAELRRRASALAERQEAMVNTLLDECEQMLERHGDRLALVIW